MQGISKRRVSWNSLLLISLMLLLMPLQLANTSNAESSFYEEIELDSGEQQSRFWNVTDGEWYSIQISCNSCSSSLLIDGTMIDSEIDNYHGQVSSEGLLEARILANDKETVFISALVGTSDDFVNVRPSPTESMELISPYSCDQDYECIDIQSSELSSYVGNDSLELPYHVSGIIDSSQPEFLGFIAEDGDTVEITMSHTSSDASFELYFQNQTSEVSIGEISSTTIMMNSHSTNNVFYHTFEEDGRAIIRIDSDTINAIWALKITIHPEIDTATIDLANVSEVFGHNSRTIIFDINDTEASILDSQMKPVNYTFSSLVNGIWLFTGEDLIHPTISTRLYPLPEATAIKLTLSGDSYHVKLTTEGFDDIESGLEAPSLPPIYSTTDNSSWPALNVKGESVTGQFTNSILDSSDVYKLEIDGWEDSIHFLKFEVDGQQELFEIELISKDSEDWSELESKTRTYSLGNLQVAMEVPRGTHFFRISLINSTFENNWGDYLEPITYTITPTYELVEEGEEPWFPPDENAKKWGNVVRWSLGFMLLIPAIYLIGSQRQKGKLAEEMKTKKQRLNWLKSRLDDGISPRSSRKILAKSLEAVAILDWEDACSTWGPPEIHYRTNNVALAAWKIDKRIAKNDGCWPIIIGVYIIKGNWEISALRLDSPEGEAWNIKSVTPRFLFSGEEIFLDSMTEGNKTFLSVELFGNANSVDIELNGRLEGEPSACRASKTLLRTSEEE